MATPNPAYNDAVPLPIVFDTDPGIDDALALLLALASPELEVVGLTTVFGNAATPQTTANALHLLSVAGREGVPVVAGAGAPLARPFAGPSRHVHGEDGLGNLERRGPVRAATAWPGGAAGFIVDAALSRPGALTLVAVGPLTNLALALRRDARLPGAVRQVIVMGGAVFCAGNATPVAEANVYKDPEAARVVLGAGWPVTLVSLDVTLQTCLDRAGLEAITQAGTPTGDLISRIAPFYYESYRARYGMQSIPMHDPSAMAYAIEPGLFETRPAPLYVEVEGRCAGQTVADLRRQWSPLPEVDVCVGVDSPRLLRLFQERLARGLDAGRG
jgi:inosine-uridine nucleoside N-ribohydrolase